MSKKKTLEKIELKGLQAAPSQVWGAIRIVPLVKDNINNDIRLSKVSYKEPTTMVSLKGELLDEGIKYISYVPHGLIVSWNDKRNPDVSFGTNLQTKDGKTFGKTVRIIHRMVKKIDKNQLRILPLHIAMEGFLSLYFGGPEIAWEEYSRQAISRGLDPRWENTVSGTAIPGLEDALRLFEIHNE